VTTLSQSDSTLSELNPVLIVSPPRSGSSLTSNLVQSLGLFAGNTKAGDTWNQKGYYENEAITDILVDYLRKADKENLGKQFQPIGLNMPYPDFGTKVITSVREQGKNPHQRWFYKNTKTPLTWRLWHEHFPKAQWVIVKRNREQLLDSLMRTPFMTAYKTRAEWEGFLVAYDVMLSEIENNTNHFVFHVNSIFDGDMSEVERLASYINRGYMDSARSCIDKGLWNVEK
jgi:hypothetical protein